MTDSTHIPIPGIVAYRRCSTKKQEQAHSLESQDRAIDAYLAANPGLPIVDNYVEVESGGKDSRPVLARALARCRETGAKLVVAKLDRLSRNPAFLLALLDSKVQFVFLDAPDADPLLVGMLAVVAGWELRRIRERTKAGLATARAKGKKLGGMRKGCEAAAKAGRKKSHRNSNLAAIRRHLMEDAPAMQVVHRVLAEVPLNRPGRAALAIAELNALAVPCRSGKPWDSGSFAKLLQRARVYGSARARAKIGGTDAAPDA